jgi:Tol biopolymer transport system component
MKKIFLGICLFSALMCTAVAASLREQGGDIFYVGDDGQSRQLTTSKNNGGAVLSPDGRKVAYLHIRPKAARDHALFRGNEIWLVDVAGGDMRRVVKTRVDSDSAEANLSQFNSLVFSVAGDRLYFLSEGSMEIDALHVLDISTGKQKYLTEGNSIFVIPSGRYVGYLIVEQQQYLAEGGHSNDYWLLTASGKEIKMVGKTRKLAMTFVEREK